MKKYSLLKTLIIICFCGLYQLSIGQSNNANNPPTPKLYQITFLKSTDDDPTDLVAYIQANWFAMDAQAKQQGLITSYELFVSDDKNKTWNVMVRVGYPTVAGYSAIRADFEKIRKAHRIVLVKGKGMKSLGKFIGSRNIRPVISKK